MRLWSPVRNHPYMSEVDRLLTGKSPTCLRLQPLVSHLRPCGDGAPQTTHDIWETGLQGLPTGVTLPLRAIQLRLSKGATGVPCSQHGTLLFLVKLSLSLSLSLSVCVWQARGGLKNKHSTHTLEPIRARAWAYTAWALMDSGTRIMITGGRSR